MSQIGHLKALVVMTKKNRRTYFLESLQAIGYVLLFTILLFVSHLYPRIHYITLMYVLIVGILAFRYGHFVAVVAAIASYICLDFFFVSPLYTLTIDQPDEALSLLVFLAIALLSGFGCAQSRRRYYQTCIDLNVEKQKNLEETNQRAHQFHTLYEMVEAIKREQSLESQLNIIAQVIVENFSSFGVHGCIILLPDEEHKPSVLAEWPKSTDIIKLMADESVLGAAIYVMVHKEALILHLEGVLFGDNHSIFLRRVMTSTTGSIYTNRHYASMVPIHLTHDKVVVLLLLMEESDNLSISNKEEFFTKDGNLSPQTEFFWRINDQIKFVVEEARLQREQLELKILGREEKLHANLIQWVSHGLRSPLTMIKLDAAQATQVLQEIEPSYGKIHNSLQSIEHAANRLNHFVDDLLDMARSKGGMLKPRMSTYYIDDLVNEIVAEMKELIGDRSVAVNVPDLPLLKLDPIHIKHVLTNLIENAIRYTPADSLLEISAQIDGKHVQVDVADRGPGISPDDQKHLFEPYYQGNRKSRQGKGLGLAVCQALVEAHEGRIWVESREGGGTIFRFTLPLPKTGGEDESKGTMYSYRG